MNYIYGHDTNENDTYYPISHVKYDKFFNSIPATARANIVANDRYTNATYTHTDGVTEDIGYIKDYRKASHITQSILCDPETTPDITKFNDCQIHWGCDIGNSDVEQDSESDGDWDGHYIPLPRHHKCGEDNILCNMS